MVYVGSRFQISLTCLNTERGYNKVMNKTIKTIDGELVELNENWKDVWGLPFNEKWVECPTLIDENEHLWVDESVLD